jgi:heptosyltransferase-2
LMPALGWPLTETAALLAEAAFYVGNNTGVMNMAAAVGIPTYALFGTTPPFHHSRRIVPIVSPSGGPIDGMERVTVAAVLDVIRVSRGTLEPVRAATYGAG